MKKEKLNYAKLQPHHLGAIFPPMGDTEYSALKKSMKANGYDPQHPIIIHEGAILDGNNRYTAAKAVKADPVFREWESLPDDVRGPDAFSFVMKENLNRRHLTPSQLATIGASLVEMMKEQEKAEKAAAKEAEKAAKAAGKKPAKAKPAAKKKATGTKAAKAAKAVNVSERSVAAAASLKDADPEEFKKVQAGHQTLHAGTQAAEAKKSASARQSDAYGVASEIIDKVCGENWVATIEKKISAKEIIKMSGLDHEEMKRIKPFIEAGWTLSAAMGYKSVTLSPAHTIRHLILRAIENGGMFTLDVEAEKGEWIIAVTKKVADPDKA